MKKFCPICQTEMLERSNIHVCPRNDIGDCSYDALNPVSDELTFFLDQSDTYDDLRCYVSTDSK